MILVVAIIVPVFVNIFNEIKADSPNTDTSLPLMTQITVGVSHFVTHYWYVLIAATAGAAYGFLRWKKTDRGRHQWDRAQAPDPADRRCRPEGRAGALVAHLLGNGRFGRADPAGDRDLPARPPGTR